MTEADNPFAWLKDLVGKPIAMCIGCRRPYFPHLESCDQCEGMLVNTLYIHAAQNRMADEFWKNWQGRHQRHG